MSRKSLCFLLLAVDSSMGWTQDVTAPRVSITSLADHDFVGETILVKANATDNVGVTSVPFLKGATVVVTDTAAPFEAVYSFNSDQPNADYVNKGIASAHDGQLRDECHFRSRHRQRRQP